MGKAKVPPRVNLFIGIIFSREASLEKVEEELRERFGEICLRSPRLAFNLTSYYEKEMGKGLQKIFLGFKKLIKREKLPEIKLYTNDLEDRYSCQSNRQVNLDPGYLTSGQVILATTKDYQHRIYLGKGIFGEVTLRFKNGSFQPWDWTYPDYRQESYTNFFNELRKIYLTTLKLEKDKKGG